MNWFRKIIRKIFSNNEKLSDSLVITAVVPHMESFEFHIHSVEDQYITGELLQHKIWEPFETEVFRRLCRPGDFVVDIGANIGWYSVIATRLIGSTGKVLSVEPDITNLRLLEMNLIKSGGTGKSQILNVALGDNESSSRLFLSVNNLGDHRLFDDGNPRESITVKVQTLDDLFVGSEQLPTLIKSDTQGSEAKILRGASNLLASGWRPVFILEFWPYGLVKSGDDPINLWKSLISLGYHMYEVSEGNPKLIYLTGDRLNTRVSSDISPESTGFINLLCLPSKSDRLEIVQDLIYETKSN